MLLQHIVVWQLLAVHLEHQAGAWRQAGGGGGTSAPVFAYPAHSRLQPRIGLTSPLLVIGLISVSSRPALAAKPRLRLLRCCGPAGCCTRLLRCEAIHEQHAMAAGLLVVVQHRASRVPGDPGAGIKAPSIAGSVGQWNGASAA